MSTTVNKIPYDFCSMQVELGANGESFGIMEGIDSIDYKATMNRTKLYGTSRLPIAETDGDVEFDASITFLQSWFDLIVDKAKAMKVPLAQLELTLAISYQHRGEVMHTDTLTTARFAEIGKSNSRGPDPNMVSCPLSVMNIYFDGIDVLGGTL